MDDNYFCKLRAAEGAGTAKSVEDDGVEIAMRVVLGGGKFTDGLEGEANAARRSELADAAENSWKPGRTWSPRSAYGEEAIWCSPRQPGPLRGKNAVTLGSVDELIPASRARWMTLSESS